MGRPVSLSVSPTAPIKSPPRPPATGLHPSHVLAATVGSFLALVIYSLVAGPTAYEPVEQRQPQTVELLRLHDFRPLQGPAGVVHVQGVVENTSTRNVQFARITILLKDARQSVLQTLPVTIDRIPPHSRRQFSANAQESGVKSVEARIDDAL